MSDTLVFLIAALAVLFPLLVVIGLVVPIVRSVQKMGGMQGIMTRAAQELADHPSRSYNIRTPIPRTAYLPIIIFTLIGGSVIAIGVAGAIQWNLIQEARLLVDEGREIEAVVVDRSISRDDDGDETFYVWYQFETVDRDPRETIKRRETVSESLYQQSAPGAIVDVIYVPSRPQTARLVAQYRPGQVRYLPLVMGSIFSASLLLGTLYFRRQHEWALLLDAEGVMVEASLLDKYIARHKQSTTHYVAYEVPGGGPIRHGVSRQTFERLQVGQMVLVRYLPEHPNIFRLES